MNLQAFQIRDTGHLKHLRQRKTHHPIRACLTLVFTLGPALGLPMVSKSATILAQAGQLHQLVPTPYVATTSTMAITPTGNFCLDRYEDDGLPSTAKPLLVGETQEHIFCPTGDADWLTFFAVHGKAYKIETSKLDLGVDTILYLFAPDGRALLGGKDDAPGAHGPSQIVFHPQSDGWYYVQAKNQGDIGYTGLRYSISLSQVDPPTITPISAVGGDVAPNETPVTTSDLLHPQQGGAGGGGIPVFIAGPADAMQPDGLELDDTKEQAKPLNVGAKYSYLNFVPGAWSRYYSSVPAPNQDTDFYTFHAKPGLCYLVQTSDLSVGLDTTVVLWQLVTNVSNKSKATSRWKPVAQNDDAHPRTADLSSAVRWCASTDLDMVVEVRNYGGKIAADARGKSYSLAVLIDRPTPTYTRRPAPSSVQAPQSLQVAQSQHPSLTLPPSTPLITHTPISPISPTSPTAVALQASVDVVAYIADTSSTGPNPGDGIVGLPVLLVDVRTNAVIKQVLTDRNGHTQLTWLWQDPQGGPGGQGGQGAVRVAMPAFRWGKTLQLRDFASEAFSSNTAGPVGPRSLLLQARMSSYELPGIFP